MRNFGKICSLRNIESQLSLQQQLEELVTQNKDSQVLFQEQLGDLVLQNQVSAAGGLIGKLVSGVDDINRAIEGLVTSVRVQDGKTMLELDSGATLSMGQRGSMEWTAKRQ